MESLVALSLCCWTPAPPPHTPLSLGVSPVLVLSPYPVGSVCFRGWGGGEFQAISQEYTPAACRSVAFGGHPGALWW